MKPKLKTKTHETRIRLTEEERDTLERVCYLAGVNMTDVLRTTINLFQPYLDIPGCMDKKYLNTLARAIRNPNALTIQQLEDERTDVLQNEQDAILRSGLTRAGLPAPKHLYAAIRDVVE